MCSGPGASQCLSCSEPYHLSIDNKCVTCSYGLYYGTGGYCVNCPSDCTTCSSATVCLTCSNPAKSTNRYGKCVYPKCAKGTYRAGNACLPCHSTCRECSPSATSCSTCVKNAHLSTSSDCECNSGYIEATNSCEPMSAVSGAVAPVSNTELQLTLNSTIPGGITAQDLSLSIPGLNFTWSVTQEGNSTYSIQLHFDTPPTKAQLAEMKIAFAKRLSNLNAPNVQSLTLSSLSPSHVRVNGTAPRSALSSQSSRVAQGAVGVGLLSGFLSGHMSSAWCLINTIQILLYAPMMNFTFTDDVSGFLSGLMSYNFIPNPVQYTNYTTESPSLQYAVDFGYDSDSILVNDGNTLLMIVLGLLAYPTYKQLSRTHILVLAQYFRKKHEQLRFSYFVRAWIEMYLEIGIVAVLKALNYDSRNIASVCECILAGTILVILTQISISASPLILSIFLLHNKKLVLDKDHKFDKAWGEWYGEFRLDKGMLPALYYFFFFTRRLTYILIIFLLHDYPTVQFVLCIASSLAFLGYLLRWRPLENHVDKVVQIFVEFGILVVFCMSSVFLYSLYSDLDLWSMVVICTVLGIMGVCLLGIVAQCVLTMVAIYNQHQGVKRVVKIMTTIVPSMEKDQLFSMLPNVSYKPNKVNPSFLSVLGKNRVLPTPETDMSTRGSKFL